MLWSDPNFKQCFQSWKRKVDRHAFPWLAPNSVKREIEFEYNYLEYLSKNILAYDTPPSSTIYAFFEGNYEKIILSYNLENIVQRCWDIYNWGKCFLSPLESLHTKLLWHIAQAILVLAKVCYWLLANYILHMNMIDV